MVKEQEGNGGCPVIRLTLAEATMLVHVLDDDFRYADPMITKARIWELARKLESRVLEVKAQQEKVTENDHA